MRSNKFLPAVIFLLLVISNAAFAQQVTDVFDVLMKKAAANNPGFRKDLRQLNDDIRLKAEQIKQAGSLARGTVGSLGTIPVVFHIVLDSQKMKQLGDITEIEKRIKGQLEVLNDNFNAENADSADIPAPFKALCGSVNVRFALAHTGPGGKYTKGYEIIYTAKTGFDENNLTMGSQFACSDAKFAASGGADAWDTKKYYNVWVANILPAGLGGLGTPPPYPLYGGTQLLPFNEQGTVISYAAFGKKETPGQYFPWAAALAGRTLVHETGHFLNLFHTFGMSTLDNSNCQDDDGVTDTPPQALPTLGYSGKPPFPLTDACSQAAPGKMWMNHMDYTNDLDRIMFTQGQADRIMVEFQPGGYRYELLQHPELLNAPAGIHEQQVADAVSIWPNPVTGICTISLPQAGNDDGQLVLVNSMGQVQQNIPTNGYRLVRVDMSSYAPGNYMIQYRSSTYSHTTRVVKL